jgi:hypothetical protein
VLLLVQVLPAKAREFEQDLIHNLLSVNLRLEPKAHVYIVAALVFLVKDLTAAVDHDILAKLSEVGREVRL